MGGGQEKVKDAGDECNERERETERKRAADRQTALQREWQWGITCLN